MLQYKNGVQCSFRRWLTEDLRLEWNRVCNDIINHQLLDQRQGGLGFWGEKGFLCQICL